MTDHTTSKTTTKEVQHRILSLLKELRDNTSLGEFDRNQIANYDIRIGHIGGKRVARFVIHLRSNGCQWCKQTGGCTMCGFWNETTQRKRIVTAREFVNQFENALDTFDLQGYPVLSLYNAGSLLQEKEIPFSAVEEIFFLVAEKLPNLRQLIIESRTEYITKEKLETLLRILGNNVRLAIGIGFESQNDIVRNLFINKGVSKKKFEKTIELTNLLNIHSIIYLILKPPFLTEQESIEEAVASTEYVSEVGVSEINYETMTIEDNTLVNVLYKNGYYKLPWLWSIVEILKKVRPFAKPFLTSFSYIAEAVAIPKNCPVCTELVTERIYEKYCSDFSLSHFENLNCACKTEWLNIIQEQNTLSLEERALGILSKLSV